MPWKAVTYLLMAYTVSGRNNFKAVSVPTTLTPVARNFICVLRMRHVWAHEVHKRSAHVCIYAYVCIVQSVLSNSPLMGKGSQGGEWTTTEMHPNLFLNHYYIQVHGCSILMELHGWRKFLTKKSAWNSQQLFLSSVQSIYDKFYKHTCSVIFCKDEVRCKNLNIIKLKFHLDQCCSKRLHNLAELTLCHSHFCLTLGFLAQSSATLI